MSHPIIIPVRFGALTNDVVCDCVNGQCERHGMCDVSIGYLCGRKPPNYPVPAIRANHMTGGGIQGHFVYICPWFVDWSRGSIEVY